MASVTADLAASPPSLDEIRVTAQRWLSDAQDECLPSRAPADLEWLCGRVRALMDLLAFLDDRTLDASYAFGASTPDVNGP